MKSTVVGFRVVATVAFVLTASGFARTANATTITVDAFSSASGTPITIGNSAFPQYSFIDGTFIIYPAIYIQGNNGSKVAFPFNGTPQPFLPMVVTNGLGNAFNGDFQLEFDIGTTPYTGLATVVGGGTEITTITYSPAVAATPLPSTWPLMILGFASIGFQMYWRKPGAARAA